MLKTVTASLCIEVNVDCPHCDSMIDIMRESETDGYDHNEEGLVLSQACPDGCWHTRHEEFEVRNVTCGQCKKDFDVKGLDW